MVSCLSVQNTKLFTHNQTGAKMLKSLFVLLTFCFATHAWSQEQSSGCIQSQVKGDFYEVCVQGKIEQQVGITELRDKLAQLDLSLPNFENLHSAIAGTPPEFPQITRGTLAWPTHTIVLLSILYDSKTQSWHVHERGKMRMTNWPIIGFFSLLCAFAIYSGNKKLVGDMILSICIAVVLFFSFLMAFTIDEMGLLVIIFLLLGIASVIALETGLWASLLGLVIITMLGYFFAKVTQQIPNHGWQPVLNFLILAGIPVVIEGCLTILRRLQPKEEPAPKQVLG